MAQAVHRAADGSAVTFDGPVDLAAAVTSSVRHDADGVVRELTTAPVSAMAALPFRVAEEYAHGAGTLLVGHREEAEAAIGSRRRDTFAVWQGAAHALLVVEAEAPTEVLLALLDSLTLVETAEGLVIEGDGLVATSPRLVKEITGVGLAEVAPLVPEVAQALPRWSGTEATGGELYRDEARPGAPVLVLVGDSAVTTVLLDVDAAEADPATDQIAGLTVTWEPPT